MHYVHKAGFGTKPIDGSEAVCQALFSGKSWKLCTAADMAKIAVAPARTATGASVSLGPLKGTFEQTQLSHRGSFVHYTQTPQLNGSTSRTATISDQKRITDADRITDSQSSPPFFAGTIWFDCTRDFIRTNASTAKAAQATVVSGVRTQVLEWDVAEADRMNAFHSVNDLTKRGGKLRLYIARELGYALPLIEYVGADGQIADSFSSSNFDTCGGVHIPRQCVMQYYTNKGPGFYLSYDVVAVKRVNERIADNEFTIRLAPGTFVTDRRDPKATKSFTVKDGIALP